MPLTPIYGHVKQSWVGVKLRRACTGYNQPTFFFECGDQLGFAIQLKEFLVFIIRELGRNDTNVHVN